MHIFRYALAATALALVTPVGASARNLEAKVSYEHNLWWEAPETPTINITLRDTTGNANRSTLIFRVTPDVDERQELVNVSRQIDLPAAATADFNFNLTIPQPGFYKCFVLDDGNEILKFNIGYEPTLVYSLPDAKPDFDAFWDRAKAELAKVPGEYTLVEDPSKKGEKRRAFAVSMKSLGGETIKGYLYMPIAPGKYPVQIYYNGYGGKPWDFDVDGRPDWIEFVSSVRGQMYSQPDNTYGDWIRYNLDKPEEYYYRGAFMDVIRIIDFVEQLPQADPDLIFAEGGSQGGALTLVAASLDNRLKGIAPYVPFLSDYKDYFKIVPWPASAVFEAQKELGISDSQLYDNLSYFDVKNFVRRIECPVMMGIGLQDPTCPPHTNMATYTLIKSPKELIIYPECGHTVDYSDWNPRRDRFFNEIINRK